ncbi:MAG: glycerol-3-phosphate 1-O-acyltransferase PlsY, partial [bacterium]|nr:glycerol-3-phosphate 1-O-acyltransferase PlsY [bacterium]
MTAAGAILLAAYLIGSIPFAWIAGRMARIDIRAVGSGNIGASNVYRAVGPAAGILVLAADISKGVAAVWIARKWGGGGETILVLAGLAAIAGHTWTIFLHFRGGKGVATASGVLFSLVPMETSICLVLFLVCVAFGRMISLGSIVAAAALP